VFLSNKLYQIYAYYACARIFESLTIPNYLFCSTCLLLFFPLFCGTDSVPSAEATMYSGEPALMVILLTDC